MRNWKGQIKKTTWSKSKWQQHLPGCEWSLCVVVHVVVLEKTELFDRVCPRSAQIWKFGRKCVRNGNLTRWDNCLIAIVCIIKHEKEIYNKTIICNDFYIYFILEHISFLNIKTSIGLFNIYITIHTHSHLSQLILMIK